MIQKEEELAAVKRQYCGAVKEKQKLTNEAEVCRRKMSAASTLINGLSGEKMRWTQQSKAFKEQMVRLVGDVLLGKVSNKMSLVTIFGHKTFYAQILKRYPQRSKVVYI